MIRAVAAVSCAMVAAAGTVGVVAFLPTTRVVSTRQLISANDLPPLLHLIAGRGVHVTVRVGNPGLTIDQLYFVNPCSVNAGVQSLEVSCPDGPVERWLEPSRVWVVVTVPPQTRLDAGVHRDAYFRAESGVTLTSVEQLDQP